MITFMGYPFKLEHTDLGERRYIVVTALDPATPPEVIEVLHRTMHMNELCMLKRFGDSVSTCESGTA